jgi:two-component system nitrate/nitrite sensor histidine kinase NarX
MVPWYAQLQSQRQSINTSNRQMIDAYANDINRLVKLIEEDNTRNIQLLRLFQMLLIFMTFVTALTGIYFTYRLVIRPLDTLRGGIVRLALGDLNARVRKSSSDEFGLVSDGFNQMAQSLQDIHNNLDVRNRRVVYTFFTKIA